jgi:antitoxin component of RelBE/YafQ-DinJ toxin-antitoxin module
MTETKAAANKVPDQTGFTSVRLGNDLREAAEKVARENGLTLSDFVREATEAAIKGTPQRNARALMRSLEITKHQAEVALKSGLDKAELKEAQKKVKELANLFEAKGRLFSGDGWPLVLR